MANRFQKKLSTKGRTDLGTDLTDYDITFIANPTAGPFRIEEGFDEIYNLEYFSNDLLEKSRAQFRKRIIAKIGINDYTKIENAVESFVKTPKNDKNIFALKKSIFTETPSIIDFNIDTDVYTKEEIQHLRPDLIEKFDQYEFSLTADEEISYSSIELYAEIAEKITKKYLKLYAAYCNKKSQGHDVIGEYEDIYVCRGFNNKFYYNPNNEYPDAISLYTNSSQGEHFFERNLLTSYTICPNVAEKFMVAFKTRRRMFIKANISCIGERMLSSFIVSDKFDSGQYEILCLPNHENLYIFEQVNNEDFAFFNLSLNNNPEQFL